MAKPAAAKKLGRNDPCHCGSGKKYKDCHLIVENQYRSEQLRLRQAQDSLLTKIVEVAQSVPERFPEAFALFWQGKYNLDQMQELDALEDRGAERFLIWFAFDYRAEGGQTLVEHVAEMEDNEEFSLSEHERILAAKWRNVHLRPYQVVEIRKGKGVRVRDLLSQDEVELGDSHAAKRLEIGELIVGHLVPGDTPWGAETAMHYLAGAAAQLTSDTAEKLIEYAELHLADLRRDNPDAAWDNVINQRSEILNHFVTALPRESPDPSMLDQIILQGRTSLQLTKESVQSLLNRKPSDDAEKSDTDAPKA